MVVEKIPSVSPPTKEPSRRGGPRRPRGGAGGRGEGGTGGSGGSGGSAAETRMPCPRRRGTSDFASPIALPAASTAILPFRVVHRTSAPPPATTPSYV